MHNAERQRLVSTLSHEPTYTLGTALKCGICLAFLILLVVIGNAREQTPIAQEARSFAPHSTSVASKSGAEAHRKDVFDDRRAKFMDKASERDDGGPSLAARVDGVVP